MSIKSKWVNLIFIVATGSRNIRLLLTPVVGLSYILFSACFVVLSLCVDRWVNLPPLVKAPVATFLFIPIILIGIFLILWSQLHFFKVKGTPVPLNPPPTVVTSGPYAYVRNPMLSGIFILLFGIGFLFNSLSLILIFTPLFILINVMEVKIIEEPELELRLGQEYLDYKMKTPMFFPGCRLK